MNCIKTCRKNWGTQPMLLLEKKSVCGSCVLETWSITKIIENSCFCSKRPIFKYDWFAGDVPTSLENSWKRSHFRNPQRVLPRSQRPFAVRWLSRTCKSLLGIAGEKHNCPERSAVALSAGWRLHFHRRISLLLTTNISFNAIHTDTSCTDFAEVNIHQAPLSLCPSDLKLRWLVWGRGFVWLRKRMEEQVPLFPGDLAAHLCHAGGEGRCPAPREWTASHPCPGSPSLVHLHLFILKISSSP